MFAFVCTKHRKYLVLDNAKNSGNLVMGLSPSPEANNPVWLAFDTCYMYCASNTVDEVYQNVQADEAMGPLSEAAREKLSEQLEEADCAKWYAVIDEMGQVVYMTYDTVHPDWMKEFIEGNTWFEKDKVLS